MQAHRQAFFLIVAVRFVSCTLALPAFVDSTNDQQSLDSENDESKPNHSQVLVLGAGPSGVAAASRLMENGVLDVTILEAENRVGGRIHTVWFGENVVDLGAQWVHGVRDNVVYEMAKPLGLLEENATSNSALGKMQFVLGNGEMPDQNLLYQLLNISFAIRDDREELDNYNGSFGQFFVDKFAEYTLKPANNVNADPALMFAFLSWFERLSAFSEGADSWFNVSSKGFNAYWECEGDQEINWKKNGYHSVINLLTKRYPHPAQELPVRRKTHLRTEAKTIYWGPRGVVGPSGSKAVLVETSNGARFTADFVVVTFSLGVLKADATTLFNPPVNNRKMNAVKNIGFGHVDKIFMHFAEKWWPANITGFSILVTDGDRHRFNRLYPQFKDKGEWLSGLTGFYVLPRQPHSVLYAWLVGEPARNMEKYSDYQVMVGCIKWLAMFADRSLPWPISLTRSKWYSNPHFRGSYSHRTVDSDKYDAQSFHLAEPLFGLDGTPLIVGRYHDTGEYTWASSTKDKRLRKFKARNSGRLTKTFSTWSPNTMNMYSTTWRHCEPLALPRLRLTSEVLFAGEATHDHHFSTVHGAIETGWREADRILDLLGNKNRSRKPPRSS